MAMSNKDIIANYIRGLYSGSSSVSFDPRPILLNPDEELINFLSKLRQSDWILLNQAVPDVITSQYKQKIEALGKELYLKRHTSLFDSFKPKTSVAALPVLPAFPSLPAVLPPVMALPALPALPVMPELPEVPRIPSAIAPLNIHSEQANLGKYLILEPVDLEYRGNSDEIKLEKFLKIVQQMWTGIQNIMTNKSFKNFAIQKGLIDASDSRIFDQACELNEHSVLRCFTSRYMLNYLFKELQKGEKSDRMDAEDPNFYVTVYNLGGPSFPDHTFITLEFENSFYVLQSFYFEYSFGSLNGLIKLNQQGKQLFRQVIAEYQTYNGSNYNGPNDPNELAIQALNDRFSIFTGIDCSKHSSYKYNQSVLRQHFGQTNYITLERTNTSLFYYIGSLKFKLNSMTEFLTRHISTFQPEIRAWKLYKGYKDFPPINKSLSIFSGYENIDSFAQDLNDQDLINIVYKTDLKWIITFYFYIAQINLLFKDKLNYDLPQVSIDFSLFMDQILTPVSKKVLISEVLHHCRYIGIISSDGNRYKIDTNFDQHCLTTIKYCFVKSIIELTKELDPAKLDSNARAALFLATLDEAKYLEIDSHISQLESQYKFKSKSKKTNKSRKNVRKSKSKNRKSVRKSKSKSRKSVRKSKSKNRKSKSRKD